MDVLGISAHSFDSAAALVRDGAVLAAATEERFTRQRHDPNFPRFAVEYCLAEGQLAAHQLDAVVFFEDPPAKLSRILAAGLAGFPGSAPGFIRSAKTWLEGKLWVREEISRQLDIHPNKIRFLPRHRSHAAQAFTGSPFEQAAILVLDNVGEWAATALCSGAYVDGKLQITEHQLISYPHSLGLVVKAFTDLLGFRVDEGERCLGDLAAFGEPLFASRMRNVIQVQEDGTYRVDPAYFRFENIDERPFGRPWKRALRDRFGPPRDARRPLPFRSVPQDDERRQPVDPRDKRFADIACSLQVVLEEAVLALCGRLHRLTGADALCLTGRLAKSLELVRRIREDGPFSDIFIPPEPGEGGCAEGAALYVSHTTAGTPATWSTTPFLGKRYDGERDVASVSFANPSYWQRFRKRGTRSIHGMRIDIETHERFEDLLAGVADDLMGGRIIGWFQGRFESGSTALGARSLLADPASVATARRLSTSVKGRPLYRPFGLTITAEEAGRVIDLEGPPPSWLRWRQSTVRARAESVPLIRAAVHIDGTVRPQVVTRSESERLHALLVAHGQRSGLSALLTTGFNEADFPLVGSPADALIIFMRTELDALVLDRTVIRKVLP